MFLLFRRSPHQSADWFAITSIFGGLLLVREPKRVRLLRFFFCSLAHRMADEVMVMVIPSGPLGSMAWVRGEGCLRGTVKFYPVPCGTLVVAEITGLPKNESGFFAFHIHEGKCCTGKDFADTGGHFNPCDREHPRHAGDLPPLLSRNGRAFLAVETDRFTPREILGRTVVIHEEPDDFHTQPAGNSGRKIACGEIVLP